MRFPQRDTDGNWVFEPDSCSFGPMRLLWYRGWMLAQILGLVDRYLRYPALRDETYSALSEAIRIRLPKLPS